MVKVLIQAKIRIEIASNEACSKACPFLKESDGYCFLFDKDLYLGREEEKAPLILARCRECYESKEDLGFREESFVFKEKRRGIDREVVKQMLKEGATINQIAKTLDKSYGGIYSVVREIRSNGDKEAVA